MNEVSSAAGDSSAASRLGRLMLLRPGEGPLVLAAAAMFFCIMLGYGVVKPLRDAFGIARNADDLPWLMTITLAVMIGVNPVFSALVTRSPARVFLPRLYRFFILNIAVFGVLLWQAPESWQLNLGYAFYVWLSVFNLLALSVFWGLLGGVFSGEQSKRLFGLIGVGGTVGLISGASSAKLLSQHHAPAWVFMAGTAALLETSVWCCRALTRLPRAPHAVEQPRGDNEPGGAAATAPQTKRAGGAFDGLVLLFHSPYFLGIAAYLLIYTICSSVLYLAQQKLVASVALDQSAKTALNASIDLWVNVVTLGVQLFLTGWVVRLIGLGGALAVTPVLTAAGFEAMGAAPALSTLVPVVVTRRGLHYAVDKPAREMLYAGLSRDARYKAKSFIDTVIYRGGDVLGAWASAAVTTRGVPARALILPLCAAAVVIGALLAGARAREDIK